MQPDDKQRVGAIVDRLLEAADDATDHREELAAVLRVVAPRWPADRVAAVADAVIDAVRAARQRGAPDGARRRMRLAAFRAILGALVDRD